MLSLGRNDAECFIFSFGVSLRKSCHTFVHCSQLIFAHILWLAENRHVALHLYFSKSDRRGGFWATRISQKCDAGSHNSVVTALWHSPSEEDPRCPEAQFMPFLICHSEFPKQKEAFQLFKLEIAIAQCLSFTVEPKVFHA